MEKQIEKTVETSNLDGYGKFLKQKKVRVVDYGNSGMVYTKEVYATLDGSKKHSCVYSEDGKYVLDYDPEFIQKVKIELRGVVEAAEEHQATSRIDITYVDYRQENEKYLRYEYQINQLTNDKVKVSFELQDVAEISTIINAQDASLKTGSQVECSFFWENEEKKTYLTLVKVLSDDEEIEETENE